MADAKKKTNPTVELLLCVFLGAFGVHRFYAGKAKSGILYLLTGGLCGIGWVVDIVLIAVKFYKTSNLKKSVIHSVSSAPDDAAPAYHYDQVKFYPPIDMVKNVPGRLLKPGTSINLQTEPDNDYDPRAVALYVSGHQIGYLLRGTHQDMANDYMRHGRPVVAKLVSLDLIAGEYQGYISLSFYK